MKPRFRILCYVLCSLWFAALAAAAHAATVRGQVLHTNGHPATGLSVTVAGGKLGRSTPARVGADGMYYLFNIPSGRYNIEIWITANRPQVYQITVKEPYTDAPRVVVP